jgi:hypothetical protein
MTLIQYLKQKKLNKSYKFIKNNTNKNNNNSELSNKNHNNNSCQSTQNTNDISDNQKIKIFEQHIIKNKLNNILTLKNSFLFEYAGNMIARHILLIQ